MMSFKRRCLRFRLKYLFPLLCVCSFAAMVLGSAWLLNQKSVLPHSVVGDISPQDLHLSPQNRQVFVGYYLNNLSTYEGSSARFYADFYLWMRWPSELGEQMQFEFMNSIDRPEIIDETASDQRCSFAGEDAWIACEQASAGDGKSWQYRVYRVNGNFAYELSLQSYPFDQQIFTIDLELSQLLSHQAMFIADSQSQLSSSIHIVGWRLTNASVITQNSDYKTNFGIPILAERPSLKYSRASLQIAANRVAQPYVLKTIAPLLLIFGIAMLSLFISIDKPDARISLGTSSILSAVALHINASSGLPNVGYSTIMDYCFFNTYIHITAIITLNTLCAYQRVSRAKTSPCKRLKVLDCAAIILPITYLCGLILALAN